MILILKRILQLIFCIDISTHSGRKSKNYVKFIQKNYLKQINVYRNGCLLAADCSREDISFYKFPRNENLKQH